MLAAGIDVFSTVNVQHLESLNDQVAELTGVRVRETVPDSVLGDGRRGGADRPHARGADRAPAGRQDLPGREHRRRAQQLLPDREPGGAARGQPAPGGRGRRVQAARPAARPSRSGTREERVAADAPKAVGERLLALVRPQPSSQRLVRRAWRSAQRLGTDLDLLWVKPPGKPIEGEVERQVTALRQLASVLGATLLIEEHDDLVAAAARVVRERGTTYIMVGESLPPRGLARLREPLPQRLMRATPPGVDVRIVAHRGQQGGRERDRARPRRRRAAARRSVGGFLIARSRWRGRRSERPGRGPPDPAALHRHRDLAPRRRRRAAPRPGRGRDPDARLPGARSRSSLPLDARSPTEAAKAMPMLEAIEQRADRPGRPGRRPDRARPLLPPRARAPARAARASTASSSRPPPPARTGLSGDDLVWLLEKAPAEVLILRPGPETTAFPRPSDRAGWSGVTLYVAPHIKRTNVNRSIRIGISDFADQLCATLPHFL